ncbi:MAG: hypothetical protein ACJ8EB_12900 [Allosphingosinicella sp.]
MRGSVISRILAVGAGAALVALALWPAAARWQAAGTPYLVLLGVAAASGLAVLLLTGLDLILKPGRGEQVRPLRIFDIISGAVLLGFSLFQLGWLSGWLSP